MNETLLEKYGKQWNWGAFLLPGLWPMAHGYIWLGVVFLVIAFGPLIAPALRLEFFAAGLIGRIFLGLKANSMGLQRRQFASESDFANCQDTWRNVGIGVACVFLLLAIFRVTLAGFG